MKIYNFTPFKYKYVNQTTEVYKKLFASFPGSVPVEVASAIEYSSDDITCVLYPFSFIGRDIEVYTRAKVRAKKYYSFRREDFPNYLDFHTYYISMMRAMATAKAVILVLHEYDLHALIDSEFMLGIARDENVFLLMAGRELYDFRIHSRCGVSDIAEYDQGRVNAFFDEFSRKIISLPHVIDDQCLPSVVARKKVISIAVPGVRYFYRGLIARALIREQKLSYAFYLLYYVVFKMLLRFPFPQRRIRYLHELLNIYVRSASFSFTCGSTSGYFIRKFLEIPLLDSAMISFEYSFLSRLGFQAGRDYLVLMPSKVGVNSVSDLILGIPNEERDRLVENAKTQILSRHSFAARVKQLAVALDKLTRGQFVGSEWIDGRFVVKGYDDDDDKRSY